MELLPPPGDTTSEDVPRPSAANLAQLWADQFQHLTTLSLAAAGGLLILIQSGISEPGRRWWIALLFFALAAVASISGQTAVVDSATRGLRPDASPRRARNAALMLLGGGIYMAVSHVRNG